MKGKLIITVTVLGMICTICYSQEVISSGGGQSETSQICFSWTLGEIIIATADNGTTILTQGFQYPVLNFETLTDLKESGILVTVYPNPATDILYLKVAPEAIGTVGFRLTDTGGRLIQIQNVTGEISEISFSGLNGAIYYLSVDLDGKEIKTFKIIKN